MRTRRTRHHAPGRCVVAHTTCLSVCLSVCLSPDNNRHESLRRSGIYCEDVSDEFVSFSSYEACCSRLVPTICVCVGVLACLKVHKAQIGTKCPYVVTMYTDRTKCILFVSVLR
jgi:hypothetical protein